MNEKIQKQYQDQLQDDIQANLQFRLDVTAAGKGMKTPLEEKAEKGLLEQINLTKDVPDRSNPTFRLESAPLTTQLDVSMCNNQPRQTMEESLADTFIEGYFEGAQSKHANNMQTDYI